MFRSFATWPIKTTDCTCKIHTKLNTYARVRSGFFINHKSSLSNAKSLGEKENFNSFQCHLNYWNEYFDWGPDGLHRSWAPKIKYRGSVIFLEVDVIGAVQLFRRVPVAQIFRLYRQANKRVHLAIIICF